MHILRYSSPTDFQTGSCSFEKRAANSYSLPLSFAIFISFRQVTALIWHVPSRIRIAVGLKFESDIILREFKPKLMKIFYELNLKNILIYL
jgi:hypothetical protein